ncbi:MAG: EamA family transporter, partial [Muribaculaceae bacterium]|nr:EamA family transporter [Muribaculaceae bacterium]
LRQASIVTGLGILFAMSSLSLFFSFKFMDVGIASTLLFIYPVMVAVIMSVFFHERVTSTIVSAIVLALIGVGMLCQGDNGATINAIGISLVMMSSLAYAIYMVAVQKIRIDMPTEKLTFYVLIVCSIVILIHSAIMPGTSVEILAGAKAWGWALFLAIVPTVMSIDLANVALREIGSTPTAIMGALEPLTAVMIGATVFGEPITLRLSVGIVLILGSVMLVIAGKSIKKPKFIQHRYIKNHE